jgi:hypothetical protein
MSEYKDLHAAVYQCGVAMRLAPAHLPNDMIVEIDEVEDFVRIIQDLTRFWGKGIVWRHRH